MTDPTYNGSSSSSSTPHLYPPVPPPPVHPAPPHALLRPPSIPLPTPPPGALRANPVIGEGTERHKMMPERVPIPVTSIKVESTQGSKSIPSIETTSVPPPPSGTGGCVGSSPLGTEPEYITPQQMAIIQNQIRRYKSLAKKFNDLKAAFQSSNSLPPWQSYHLLSGMGSTAGQEGMLGLNVCVCNSFFRG
jgi:hypothetical protein